MPRTRSKYIDHAFEINGSRVDEFGSTTNTWGTPTTQSHYTYMTDSVSPEYFSKRRRGQFLPVNAMTQDKKTVISSPTSWDFDLDYNGTPKGTTHWSGDLGMCTVWWHYSSGFPSYSGSTPSWPSTSPLVTEALANARSRGFDVLTFMAEWAKTVDLIKNFGDRTLKRAEKVAASLGKSSDPAAAFAETWLEARYGWRILAYDIEAINEAIDKLSSSKSPYVRGYAEDENVVEGTQIDLSTPYIHPKRYSPYASAPWWGAQAGSWTNSRTRNVRTGVLLEAVIQDILEIDPLATGWEIIPFSFIVDWFVNIGDTIKAFSPFAQENLLGAWISERETTSWVLSLDAATYSGSGWGYTKKASAGPALVTHEHVHVERNPTTPSASLSFNLNFDELKLVDLVSIFIARYARIMGGILKSNRI